MERPGGGNIEKQLSSIIKKAEIIVVMMGALNHHCMWKVRDLAEHWNIPVVYHEGFGASGAFDKIQQINVA